MQKLRTYTRQCKHCDNWFDANSRHGEVCQVCKDEFYNCKKGKSPIEKKKCVICGKPFYRNTKVRKGRGLQRTRPKNSVCCCKKCSRINVKYKRKI